MQEEKRTLFVDFSSVPIVHIDGRDEDIDLSETIGKHMYYGALENETMELGRRIYSQKQVELTAREAGVVLQALQSVNAYVKHGLVEKLTKYINTPEGNE